ncbi:hypothetical protein B0H12DRAFT_1239752 [Mycena haematopus]|nr:hypothetical protein B0H12DRAFT_1239752 [Mycena haematopus]
MNFLSRLSRTHRWLREPRAQPDHIRHATRRSLHSTGPRRRSAESGKSTQRTPVSTLDPARLKASDHVDISSLVRYPVRVQSTSENGIPANPPLPYHKLKGIPCTFPPRTAGYFYFHRPEGLPSAAGAIRFRITSVNPANFSKGHDLLRPDGVPWEVTLPTIAKTRPVLRDLILRDGLVTEAELDECLKMFPFHRAGPQTLIYRFDQPFSLTFDGAHYVQLVVGAQKYLSRLCLFHEQRGKAMTYPYSGKALVRFEHSPFPEHAHSHFVLRIVKMIDPPTPRVSLYDGYLPLPKEGELELYFSDGGTIPVAPERPAAP